MGREFITTLAAVALAIGAVHGTPPSHADAANPLVRTYHDGELIGYVMKGVNQGRRYQAEAHGVVKRDAAGLFVEELAWSHLVVNDAPVDLPPPSAAFRQRVSLDPGHAASIPNLAVLDYRLIGPVLDLLTFYADLQLGMKQAVLTGAGSHVLVTHGKPNSWADGHRVLIGEDAIDFDITLASVDASANTAVVTVRHVPPAEPRVHLPALWMRAPVADAPNNWVQVVKTDTGYEASVGKETFDVRITVSLSDGRIRLAGMDNAVDVADRVCADAALTNCGTPAPRQIRRVVELKALAR